MWMLKPASAFSIIPKVKDLTFDLRNGILCFTQEFI
jgi:hypothetical protein